MANGRTDEMVKKLTAIGGLLDYGPERSRLLVLVWRALATGEAVTPSQIAAFVSDVGLAPEAADQFLRQISEWDGGDRIVGIMGLSTNDHPHTFTIDGTRMSTWCAMDTLFLPAMLGRTATIASESPLSKQTVRLTVGPEGVQSLDPADAVVTVVVPSETDMTSVASITLTPTPKQPGGDTDGDTIANGSDPDDDNDGCTDVQELGANEALGGLRNPHSFWDFYDVWTHPAGQPLLWERNSVVNIFDILAVALRFGPGPQLSKQDAFAAALTPPVDDAGYHAGYDRGPIIGANTWDRAPPDASINIVDDILGVAAQFGHDCA